MTWGCSHRVVTSEGGHAVRVAMAMVGSRGDVQPFVALGHALRAARHEVAVTANDSGCSRTAKPGSSWTS